VTRSNPHQQLRAGEQLHRRIIGGYGCRAVDPQAIWLLEAQEEQPDARIGADIPQALEHSVSVIARKDQRVLVEHAHEPRVTALVGTVGESVRIGRGEKEHALAFDEAPVLIVERRAHEPLDQPVRKAPGVELILKLAAFLVIHRPISHLSSVRAR
jgi:hypothetical protein